MTMLGPVSPLSKSMNIGVVLGTYNTQTLYDSDIFYTLKTTGLNELWSINVILPVITKSHLNDLNEAMHMT